MLYFVRSANTKMSISQEQAQQMLEKGEKIEQEFAEYFTGERDIKYTVIYCNFIFVQD